MQKSFLIVAILALSMAVLAGCSGRGLNSGTEGAAIGGVLGGAAGSQIGSGSGKTIATVVGTLAGAALGKRLGERFGRRDRQQFGTALENNQTGHSSSWTDPDTNDQYSVTPTQTYKSNDRPCRKFRMQADVSGQNQPQTVTGTACRQPDGNWKVVSS